MSIESYVYWVVSEPITIGSETKNYVFNGSIAAVKRGNEIAFLHPDHLNSNVLVTNVDGEVVSETVYLPYGEVFIQKNAAATDKAYTGQRSESFGLLYHPCVSVNFETKNRCNQTAPNRITIEALVKVHFSSTISRH